MLYPKIDIIPNEANTIPSGSLGVYPFEKTDNIEINIHLRLLIPQNNNHPQDRSLRVWISEKAGGNTVSAHYLPQVNLTTLSTTTFRLVSPYTDDVETNTVVPMVEGRYWLNVLNLVNEDNMFDISIVDKGTE